MIRWLLGSNLISLKLAWYLYTTLSLFLCCCGGIVWSLHLKSIKVEGTLSAGWMSFASGCKHVKCTVQKTERPWPCGPGLAFLLGCRAVGRGAGPGSRWGGHVCNAKAQQGEGEKSEHQGDEGRFLRRWQWWERLAFCIEQGRRAVWHRWSSTRWKRALSQNFRERQASEGRADDVW